MNIYQLDSATRDAETGEMFVKDQEAYDFTLWLESGVFEAVEHRWVRTSKNDEVRLTSTKDQQLGFQEMTQILGHRYCSLGLSRVCFASGIPANLKLKLSTVGDWDRSLCSPWYWKIFFSKCDFNLDCMKLSA